MLACIVLAWWNARGLSNTEVVLKERLAEKGAVYCGVSEPKTYKDEGNLSDCRWDWSAGVEGKPTALGYGPQGGVGAFVDKERVKSSVVSSGSFTIWHRMELEGGTPLVVGTGYFPQASDLQGHRRANSELLDFVRGFRAQGPWWRLGGT